MNLIIEIYTMFLNKLYIKIYYLHYQREFRYFLKNSFNYSFFKKIIFSMNKQKADVSDLEGQYTSLEMQQ